MTDYSNGQNTLIKRPEPGRPVHAAVKEEKQPQNQMDVNAIANAVIEAINKKIPNIVVREGKQESQVSHDVFDNTKSMEKLAQAMTVQRGGSESNFDDLGKVSKTVRDNKDVNKTIDLLKDVGD